MQNIKKYSELIKRCLIITFGAAFAIIAIVLFALNFSMYDDSYGTDFSFDMDSVVFFMIGIAIMIYGIYAVYAYKSNKSLKYPYFACFGVVSVLLSFYPLGVFFKALAKEKPFVEYQDYLYVGILGCIMIAYLLFSYLSSKKEK